MKVILPKIFGAVVILASLVCLTALAARYQTDTTRENRDRALTAAVRANNPAAVTHWLAEGASPNCRELPPDTRTLWQKLTAFLRPTAPMAEYTPSALGLAVQNNIYADAAEQEAASFAILRALRERGASAESSEETGKVYEEHFERFAAQEKADFSPFTAQILDETRENAADPGESTAADEERSLRSTLTLYGMSVRGYRDLARCAALEKKYDAAIRFYRVALLWKSNDAALQAEFDKTAQIQRFYAGMDAALSPGNHALAALPFSDGSGRNLWATVTGRKKEDGVMQVRCAMYQQEGAERRCLCQSAMLRVEWKWTDAEGGVNANDAQLMLRRVTGKRLPDILLCASANTKQSTRSRLNLFTWEKGRLNSLCELNRAGAFDLKDLRKDGQMELLNTYEIREAPPRRETADGSNIYIFRKGKLVLADAEFPEQFHDEIGNAEDKLSESANDYGICYYLAYHYSLTGEIRKSAQCYRRAERLCREDIADADNAETRAFFRRQLRRIRARAMPLID